MNRESVRPVVLALLAIVAIGFAAAMLSTPVEQPGSSGTGLGGDREGIGEGNSGNHDSGNGGNSSGGPMEQLPFNPICWPFLNESVVIAGIVGAIGVAGALAYRRGGVFGSIAVVVGFGLPTVMLHTLLTNCKRTGVTGGGDTPSESGGSDATVMGNGTPSESGGSASGSAGGSSGTVGNGTLPEPGGSAGGWGGLDLGSAIAPVKPSMLVVALLGLTLVAALVLLVTFTSGAPSDEEESVPAADDEVRMAAVGRSASAAADRIEATDDLDNEVYRAWREMTTHLDVARPESSCPGEFAAAAVRAGLDCKDVDALTTLFEEVRYGDRPASEHREQRALAALRRIEAEYADDDPVERDGRVRE